MARRAQARTENIAEDAMSLKLHCRSLVAAGLCCAAAASIEGAVTVGEKAKIDGVITARAGDHMTVKTDEGDVVALLTTNTDVKTKKGRLGLIKEGAAATALIPGLRVGVEGVGDERGQLIATKVRFAADDLKTARAIQAGMAETEGKVATNAQGIAANKQAITAVQGEQAELAGRIGQLGDYDIKAEVTVYFDVGSAVISEEGARELAQLAAQAKDVQGYMIGVEGYADSTGGAALNQKLSLDRSQAVVNWLAQNGGIPFFRMLAPGAMSSAKPAASNETTGGRAQNRRVMVRVLVNRGIAGG
jgi:OOP family OmpA-OmpF porin